MLTSQFRDHIFPALIDLVDDSVIQRFPRIHEMVAFHVPFQPFDGLAGHFRHERVHFLLGLDQPFRVDGYIRHLSLRAAGGLMDHYLAVGQCQPLALLPCHQQERRHGRRHADAHRPHRALDIVHGVIYRHARRHRAAGAVDVQRDIRVRVIRFQKQHLRHDGIGHLIVDLAAKKNDPILEQT